MIRVFKIEATDTAMVKRIVQIHDEMPRMWNPTHQVSQEFLDDLLEKIQSSVKPQGLWILSQSESSSPDLVDGMLWATIQDSLGIKVCDINSFWIRSELRNQALAPLLTEQCVLWAKQNNAKKLNCSTHSNNSRMREILEKHRFEKGMIQYTLDL